MGPGARNRGAYCDLIPDSLPGVGYVTVDGIAEPIRVRFCYYTDDDIAGLGKQVPPSDTPDRPGLVLIKGTAA